MINSAKTAAALIAVALPTSSTMTGASSVSPVFQLGDPKYSGSGCPRGTVDVVTSSDGQTVSILFSQYTTTSSSMRKACNLMVPVDVLTGITIGIFKSAYRGYAYVPAQIDSYVDFNATYFFAGGQGPVFTKKWGPKTNEEIYLSHKTTATSTAWSGCKPSTILRINTAISAYKPSPPSTWGDDPQISIDSTDIAVEKGIELFITYKRC